MYTCEKLNLDRESKFQVKKRSSQNRSKAILITVNITGILITVKSCLQWSDWVVSFCFITVNSCKGHAFHLDYFGASVSAITSGSDQI